MQLFAVIGLVFLAISISAGLGRHAFYLTLDQLEKALKWLDIGQVMLVISPMLTKISISLFLLRLFQIKKVYSWSLYGLMIFIVGSNLPLVIILMAQCQPNKKLWLPWIPGNCWSLQVEIRYAYYQGGMTFSVSDI